MKKIGAEEGVGYMVRSKEGLVHSLAVQSDKADSDSVVKWLRN